MDGETVVRSSLVERWLEYTKDLPSPLVFRKWAGIHAIGAAAKRQVWTQLGENRLYPNLFVFLVGPPGTGKCLGPEVPILMFDGSTKLAGDIQVGDTVMGPDSRMRTVTCLSPGYGPMFRIVPVKGMPWTCNLNHILSVKQSAGPDHGKVKFIRLIDYLQLVQWKQEKLKLWRTGVDFETGLIPPSVDPYMIGVLLGDGSVGDGVQVTTKDPEIVAATLNLATQWMMSVSEYDYGQSASRFAIVKTSGRNNPLLDELRRLGLQVKCEDKRVPRDYLLGSAYVRSQVLAGLIDTDGSLSSGVYDYISKSKQLSEDVVFLAKSLGLAAYMKPAWKICQGMEEAREYWRVSVGGKISNVPVRIPRKKAKPSKQIKDQMVTGFSVEFVGDGPWTGFEVDKDHQFLLADFTVAHNSQALNPMTELLRKSQAVNIAPNDMTKQALLDVLYESARGAVIDGRPFDYHFLTICISELSNFMSKYDNDLTGLLTDLFDCPPSNEEKKRTSDNGKFIPFPGLSFIMGTATQNLGNTISNEMWGSGFMARVIMVYAAEDVVPADMFTSAKANPRLAEQIVVGLRNVGDLKGPMHWTPEARILLATFRRDQKIGAPVHNRLTFYVVRRWLHLGKLCMIAALSDQRMEVSADDFHLAMSWLLAAEKDMPEIFKDMVSHEDGQIHEELRSHLFALFMQSQRKPIHASVLYNFLKSRVSSYSIPRIIDVAIAADYIRRQAGTSGDDALYVPQMPLGSTPKGAI